MQVLHGLEAPPGNGVVIEVHLDMMAAKGDFLLHLESLGFENDPFLDFFPPEYHLHYTGRTRLPQSEVRTALPEIEALITHILAAAVKADVRMYAESELVRSIIHLADSDATRGLSALNAFAFRQSSSGAEVKADVHVEFASGTVLPEVRSLLVANGFYWVRTPPSVRFPSEEIATLQTSSFDQARQVFDRIRTLPLPACTGIHLEQKLGMVPSHLDLPMPPAIDVIPVPSAA